MILKRSILNFWSCCCCCLRIYVHRYIALMQTHIHIYFLKHFKAPDEITQVEQHIKAAILFNSISGCLLFPFALWPLHSFMHINNKHKNLFFYSFDICLVRFGLMEFWRMQLCPCCYFIHAKSLPMYWQAIEQ